jgi:hypothetical protein
MKRWRDFLDIYYAYRITHSRRYAARIAFVCAFFRLDWK